MKKGNNKCDGNTLLVVLMILCVLLSLTTLGIVAYDKFIKTDCGEITCK